MILATLKNMADTNSMNLPSFAFIWFSLSFEK